MIMMQEEILRALASIEKSTRHASIEIKFDAFNDVSDLLSLKGSKKKRERRRRENEGEEGEGDCMTCIDRESLHALHDVSH